MKGQTIHRPRCSVCKQAGNFRSIPLDSWQNRPHFTCMNCGATWSSGINGGQYAEYLKLTHQPVFYPKALEAQHGN